MEKIGLMSKKPKEYEFWIITAGRGMCQATHTVGFIAVKSKSLDINVLKEKAYKQLAPQCGSLEAAMLFDLEVKDVNKSSEQSDNSNLLG